MPAKILSTASPSFQAFRRKFLKVAKFLPKLSRMFTKFLKQSYQISTQKVINFHPKPPSRVTQLTNQPLAIQTCTLIKSAIINSESCSWWHRLMNIIVNKNSACTRHFKRSNLNEKPKERKHCEFLAV